LDWTTTGGLSSGQLLEFHHLDNYRRTIILTTTGVPSSGQLQEGHHLDNYWGPSFGLDNGWRTIIRRTTGGPSCR
jgi:hypothetical protein